MDHFRDLLDDTAPSEDSDRTWMYVPYDQLSDRIGPLSRLSPEEAGIVMVESLWKPRQRPYHKQKLALILANQRHFALEQADRGVAVRYLAGADDYASQLRPVAEELGGLQVMRPAERELRHQLRPLVDDDLLEVVDHEGWLTTEEDFRAAGDEDGPWRQDAFYRAVRQRTGILMEDGSPVGGKYSHDADNREFWSGEPPAPDPPTFQPDEVTREVVEFVESRFGDHPGTLDAAHLPATREDAERLRSWAREACLEHFGPFEDAMSVRSGGLFHTRLAPLLNLHRVLPAELVEDVLEAEVPLNSKEGFIRQVVGWREFVRWVHEATDGFRTLDPDAAPSHLGAERPLPDAWWGAESGLHCLDVVVTQVLEEGWTHHIPRLMVLSNLATLMDVSPRELTDWFWVTFVDAFDWVVEPNVLAMGTFATGPLMTTKPYVSGSNYINRMSDYCDECRFDPKNNCPITSLYWAFLERHEERLDGNRRLALPLASMRKRDDSKRDRDRDVFERCAEALAEGRALKPDDFEDL